MSVTGNEEAMASARDGLAEGLGDWLATVRDRAGFCRHAASDGTRYLTARGF